MVFSCSLLHAVSQVTRGRRYAFLPFLYNDAAADTRKENAGFITNYPIDRPRRPAEAPAVQAGEAGEAVQASQSASS